MNASPGVPAGYGAQFGSVALTVLNATGDIKEGMTAFLEERKAEFTGE